MRRREFITLLGSAAATWSLAARAQQSAMPAIGFLNQESAELTAHMVAGFRKGLSETGFVENQNVAIEYRWAEGHYERLPQLAADLVNRKVAVIAAAYFPATLAAKAATSTTPIVFISGVDPIAAGLVASLNRPGGNLTGVSNFNTSLTAKRLELLHQVVPRGGSIVVLVNSTSPATQTIESEARSAAEALGVRLDVLGASTEDEIAAAFAAAAQRGAGGLLVAGDAYFSSPARATHRTGGTPSNSCELRSQGDCDRWWVDELWNEQCRSLSTGGHLYGPNPQGCQPRRFPSSAAD
jgi:putative ABC transport system substrate-binding protein